LFLSSLYSAELTRLGVALQRVDQWQQAKIWLSRALVLNPNNSSAFVNLEYNRHFQKGDKARLKPADLQRQLPALFNNTGDWRQALASNGPLDEPTTLFRLGRHFLASGGVRQAVDSLTRCIELAPDWEPPKLCLAQGYLQLDAWQLALEMTERCSGSNGLSGSSALGELLECRAAALMGLGRTNEALTCVDRFITDYGDHKEVLSSAAAIFHRIGQFERELSMLDDLLKRDPENAIVLTRKGTAQLQLAQFGPAIVTLTKSLNLAPSEDTRLCRAIAYLGTGELESARKDYQELVGKPGTSQNALFGLGTIGWRQRDTNAAMKYYEWFLTNAPAGTVQYSQASQRFKELQPR
ncbi:MAG TPA: tetratricopeptide repeat protein, partial [Candidatus Dormibacteraeota bacterium]|nr:tetratricopeptide repeat protein [Candidatus Dormibacteraeota bacterium]